MGSDNLNTTLEALKYGIDVDLLMYNLTLSYEERINQHESALTLVNALIDSHRSYDSELKQSP